jgi:hypothetical protein
LPQYDANFGIGALEQDDWSLNHHPAPTSCLSMIFFRKPVPAFRDHALEQDDLSLITILIQLHV